jgi:hypothetical protein
LFAEGDAYDSCDFFCGFGKDDYARSALVHARVVFIQHDILGLGEDVILPKQAT